MLNLRKLSDGTGRTRSNQVTDFDLTNEKISQTVPGKHATKDHMSKLTANRNFLKHRQVVTGGMCSPPPNRTYLVTNSAFL